MRVSGRLGIAHDCTYVTRLCGTPQSPGDDASCYSETPRPGEGTALRPPPPQLIVLYAAESVGATAFATLGLGAMGAERAAAAAPGASLDQPVRHLLASAAGRALVVELGQELGDDTADGTDGFPPLEGNPDYEQEDGDDTADDR